MTQRLGKYQLIRKLASGGMAEVYLAKAAGPMGFEKTLVVKRILPHLAEDSTFVEMFLSEAKLAAQLNHPHIAQIFDFGEAGGAYFLAMEYIDGPNLRVLLKHATHQGLVLPAALCARLIAAACDGLAFAHDFADPDTGEPLGLIHRDISPDNMLVSRRGALKVVDFGIAKAAGQSHKTQSGVIKGKLAYMPPEQLCGMQLDRRVDVYALGAVLYELLTGHRPFEANSDASLMQAILFEPWVPAVKRRPDLPEALQRILERALAKDREQRYPDCLAFLAELEEFILLAGKPVMPQQIAQFIARAAPNIDAPAPMPQTCTPRSGSKLATTPIRKPALMAVESSEPSGIDKPRTESLIIECTDSLVPIPSARASGKRWIPALAGAGLLMLSGGYTHFRSGDAPKEVPAPSQVAVIDTPAMTPPQPLTPEPPTEPAAPAPSGMPGASAPSAAAEQGTTAQPEQMGIVQFEVKPKGVIFLEGMRLGATPLGPVQMPAGTYNFKVRNKSLNKQVNVRVEVKADNVTYVRLDLHSDEGVLSGGMGP